MTPYNRNSLVNWQSFHEVAITPHDVGSCTVSVDDCPLGRFDHCYEKHINRWNFKFEPRPFWCSSSFTAAPFRVLVALVRLIGLPCPVRLCSRVIASFPWDSCQFSYQKSETGCLAQCACRAERVDMILRRRCLFSRFFLPVSRPRSIVSHRLSPRPISLKEHTQNCTR